ncbi:MAG TPA: carboxypeptidase-like regulatory domain-containing protein [Vicinamibacteria bacterium]|nr:carboxypeptidase-like regulatory domain-containing protein [Vicinamibacteria bacterium]
MHSWRRRASVLAVLLVLAAPLARAQETTGTIVGTVFDQTGAVLPGAAAVVKNLGTGQVREFTTSESGRYVASLLSVGRYEVTFRLTGFKSSTAKGITLHVNDRLEINGTLGLGEVTDVVEVTAAAQMIQATPAVQNLMGPTQVQELPLNNRNFVQLATLVPGVNSSLPDEVGIGLTSLVSISMAGARRNGVNWFVDGASIVDVGSNITLLATPTLESIEEFKIITSSYAAEWPRSGGGIINVVTKSGSNTFRGSAYEYYRNDALNANSFFRKQSNDAAIRDKPAPLDYHNFGATLGGPIMKDKLFFFGSYERRKIERAPSSLTANVIDPAWLSNPANANYVAPAQRDPNAVRLLSAWPQPNTGTSQFKSNVPNKQDTTQFVGRADWLISPNWRLMARYTHDLSETTEAGGLFFGTAIPDIATTLTDVPGHVAVAQLTTTISPQMLNEFSFQFSGNAIKSVYGDNVKNTRSAYGLSIPELYAENRNELIPTVAISGLSSIGAPQLFDNKYRNYTLADNLSYQWGNHQIKGGLLFSWEIKDELSGSGTQGSFSFANAGGRTAFQNFLTGNADGVCGPSCTYNEPTIEIASQVRFSRYEFYVQDSWRPRPNVSLDLGLRYSLQPGVKDADDLLTNFDPDLYSAARAPQFSSSAASAVLAGTGDPLNGILTAGPNSPHGRSIYATDKNNFMPRLGFSWDLGGKGTTVVRGGWGIYYDQVLIGIFLQNAFVNPPYVTSPQVLNPQLSNPGAGSTPATRPVVSLIASSDPFVTPKTQQWNVGVQRKLYSRGVIDVGYVGSAGDNLIQPVDINQAQPADVVRTGAINSARPYAGYATINMRQTTAKSRYHGLLVGFRHDAGRAGFLSIAYTLSQTKTDATNDRDAVDFPQNPLDLGAEYAIARTDRTHVFTANYVYELPFFRESKGFAKQVLGGWQVSGITQFWSGPPISRVVNGTTNGSRRGIRVNQVGDPFADLPADTAGGVYYFNPAAFAPPADGNYGDTGRSIFRLPGVNQWDITLSKNWYPSKSTRLQFRADFINAFNHTQFDPASIQNVCSVATTATSCAASTGNFGKLTGTRNPREIQLGLKFFWN